VSPGARLLRVASDGFESGLGAWSRRVGSVVTTADAAMSGRKGLRATLVAGAASFVQRRLPHAGTSAELAFDLNPRRFSSNGTWVEIAAITSASGQRLAFVDLRSLGRGHQVRLSSTTDSGAILHSQARPLGRRPTALVLSLHSTHASLTVDGVDLGRLARAATSMASAVVVGPSHGGPSGSSGFLDVDRVIVREAPAAP
jgi:hypothetical protein